MSSTQASERRGRFGPELGRWADALAYSAIGLYAVTLYATLGYLVYTLVSAYVTARG